MVTELAADRSVVVEALIMLDDDIIAENSIFAWSQIFANFLNFHAIFYIENDDFTSITTLTV